MSAKEQDPTFVYLVTIPGEMRFPWPLRRYTVSKSETLYGEGEIVAENIFARSTNHARERAKKIEQRKQKK